ncbi:MAG: serpin family protein [Methanomicrobiales archaeon]|nr:serpin family protein [Methanomicrobiales archaeon]
MDGNSAFGPLIFLLATCILLAGCTVSPDQNPLRTPILTTQETPVPTPSVSTGSGDAMGVTESNSRFAFDLYRNLSRDPDSAGRNLFFSPFSISSALAMTCEGARGVTAEEIRSVFHFPGNDTARRLGFQEIAAGINGAQKGSTLSTANALWAERTYAFLPGFVQILRGYYGADATNLDFIRNPEDSRMTINRWVEDHTNQKILDLIPKGAITTLTRLVITNAVYFKGTWELQFDKNLTKEEDFRAAPGRTVKVEMMERTGKNAFFGYQETDQLQVLRMPYERGSGTGLSMLIILPKGDTLPPVEDVLTLQMIQEITGALQYQRVNVHLPKFKLETEYSLSETLGGMGMRSAFDPGAADLSGMDGTRNLSISEVFHKAFVEVNEEGTEAAAATAVVVGLTSAREGPPVPEFNADHPFIFLIRDDQAGTILFLGRVTNPVG